MIYQLNEWVSTLGLWHNKLKFFGLRGYVKIVKYIFLLSIKEIHAFFWKLFYNVKCIRLYIKFKLKIVSHTSHFLHKCPKLAKIIMCKDSNDELLLNNTYLQIESFNALTFP